MYSVQSLHTLVYTVSGISAGFATALVLDALFDARYGLVLLITGGLIGMIAGMIVGEHFLRNYNSSATPTARRLQRRFLLKEAAVLIPINLISVLIWKLLEMYNI